MGNSFCEACKECGSRRGKTTPMFRDGYVVRGLGVQLGMPVVMSVRHACHLDDARIYASEMILENDEVFTVEIEKEGSNDAD